MSGQQYVCTVCGFNIIGHHPRHCPFCGAPQERFITSAECSARYQVAGTPVTDRVTRLNSVPPLGIEHAAYRLETGGQTLWIDCPSCFDRTLAPADVIIFTHHHFLGASNQYREHFSAQVWIHRWDSAHELCRGFTFDHTFTDNAEDLASWGLEAHHVGGHTPGFTLYFLDDLLFICDYVFLRPEGMIFNPFGPPGQTIAGGRKIREILKGRQISQVCGYNYVVDYAGWREQFLAGPAYVGY
jgi:hydroxyacylglutathione hydrolase